MPDLLDTVELDTAPFGERGLGEPRRDADPQLAGDELQQRPAPRRIERVEPRLEEPRDLSAGRPFQLFDDFGKARDVAFPARRGGPDQRHRLGEVADKIVGPAEQLGVDTGGGEGAHLARLGLVEDELAGQRRQCPAPFRVGRSRKIFPHQPQLAIARRREEQGIEKGRKLVHVQPGICLTYRPDTYPVYNVRYLSGSDLK